MKLEHRSISAFKKEVLRVIGEHLDLKQYKVFFFGSRVEGKGSERSDIDIGIEGSKPVPFHAMMEIKEAFGEMPILYKIDVVDFKKVSEEFYEVAKQATEPIN